VRNANERTLIGFSCRQQIEDFTGRRGMHVAEVLDMAVQEKRVAEQRRLPVPAKRRSTRKVRVLPAVASVAAGLLVGLGVGWARGSLRV
jgi:hypothetical protein